MIEQFTHRALSLQGWKVAELHPTVGSKVEIDAKMVFASFPVRPLFSFTAIVLMSSYEIKAAKPHHERVYG